MLLAYWRFAATYYVKYGKPSKELMSMQEATGGVQQGHQSALGSRAAWRWTTEPTSPQTSPHKFLASRSSIR